MSPQTPSAWLPTSAWSMLTAWHQQPMVGSVGNIPIQTGLWQSMCLLQSMPSGMLVNIYVASLLLSWTQDYMHLGSLTQQQRFTRFAAQQKVG